LSVPLVANPKRHDGALPLRANSAISATASRARRHFCVLGATAAAGDRGLR
jgi:hypothetical protein